MFTGNSNNDLSPPEADVGVEVGLPGHAVLELLVVWVVERDHQDVVTLVVIRVHHGVGVQRTVEHLHTVNSTVTAWYESRQEYHVSYTHSSRQRVIIYSQGEYASYQLVT